MAAKKKTWVAVVGIEDADGTRYEPGDELPAKLVKDNQWLVTGGKVVEG